MQPHKDIHVCFLTFRPHALCIFAESHFALYRGVSSRQNTWTLGKERDLLCVGPLLEVGMSFYTQWCGRMCDDPFDCQSSKSHCDKSVNILSKILVTYRLYINYRDIWKHLSLLNLCVPFLSKLTSILFPNWKLTTFRIKYILPLKSCCKK